MDERGSIIANSFAGSAEEIAEAVEGYASERRGVIVGVDAPLAVPNERGTRKIERILSKVALDRKSTRLNSSHANNSYAVFCLKKKTIEIKAVGVVEEWRTR